MKMINVAELVKHSSVLRKRERAFAFLKLVSWLADDAGIYASGDTVAHLERGEGIFSLSDVAEICECTKDVARRHVEAFEKAGLITIIDDVDDLVVEGHGHPKANGRLFRLNDILCQH